MSEPDQSQLTQRLLAAGRRIATTVQEVDLAPSIPTQEAILADLIPAAGHLGEAIRLIMEYAEGPQLTHDELRAYAANPLLTMPLGDALDSICAGLMRVADALGQPADLSGLHEAARRFFMGED